jgi:transcriptional regulator with XRE-family HTH domain
MKKLTREQLGRLRRTSTQRRNKVRLAMNLTGTTQVELGHVLAISQSQVSDYSRGTYSEITLSMAREFAEVFGCTVDDLFPPTPREELDK